ncbi:hypothetical protein [Methylobacter svalbardensis]|uniref:hypothetical protein n=1 Tax=Methylobacter svalbardensis TaxID=3080016 RepID=UPI0030EB1A47
MFGSCCGVNVQDVRGIILANTPVVILGFRGLNERLVALSVPLAYALEQICINPKGVRQDDSLRDPT